MEINDLQFDKRRNRVQHCPCGKSNRDGKFVPYIGHNKKGYCHSCGETFLPNRNNAEYKCVFTPYKPVLTSYHDFKMISGSGRNYKENNFVQFLRTIFSDDEVKEAILRHLIGTSDHWPGAIIFWQVDDQNRVRHGKIMLYDISTGNRKKNNEGKGCVSSVRSIMKLGDFNLKQCLFGLHQINDNRYRTIALVEGEKTAIIMSILKPEYMWIATGGKGGFNYEMLKPIKTYKIVAFPDKGAYYEWLNIATNLNSFGFSIIVDDWIENQNTYPTGTDLADVYLGEMRRNSGKNESIPEVQDRLNEKNSPTHELIFTNVEKKVNQMASKNPILWDLIKEFDLKDKHLNDIREMENNHITEN